MEKALLKRVCLCLCLSVCTYGESFNTGACSCSYTKVGVCKRSPPFKRESSKVVSCLEESMQKVSDPPFSHFEAHLPSTE